MRRFTPQMAILHPSSRHFGGTMRGLRGLVSPDQTAATPRNAEQSNNKGELIDKPSASLVFGVRQQVALGVE